MSRLSPTHGGLRIFRGRKILGISIFIGDLEHTSFFLMHPQARKGELVWLLPVLPPPSPASQPSLHCDTSVAFQHMPPFRQGEIKARRPPIQRGGTIIAKFPPADIKINSRQIATFVDQGLAKTKEDNREKRRRREMETRERARRTKTH